MYLEWNIPYTFCKNIYNNELFLFFQITVENDKKVYMQHNLYKDSEEYITIVDTNRFIDIWRLSSNDERISGYHLWDVGSLRNDYKFEEAEIGFSFGFKNPVPIVNLSYSKLDRSHREISFGNGITRTIWLLANHATYFPVIASNIDTANSINRDMGLKDCTVYPVQGLFYLAMNNFQNILSIEDILEESFLTYK